jgi:hypothetical protein
MTLFQLEPSAQAPCTSTIVAVDFVMMASPCVHAWQPH